MEPFNLDEILMPLTSSSKHDTTPLIDIPTTKSRAWDVRTKTPTRTGLLSIPPEIRQYVFEFLMPEEVQAQPNRSRGDIRLPPCQPSITKVCRVIREEALEVWWRTARFPIQFSLTNWIGSRNGVQGTPNYEMLDTLSPWVFPELRKLELCFAAHALPSRTTRGLTKSAAWSYLFVDLDKGRNSYSLTCRPRTDDATTEQARGMSKLYTEFNAALTNMLAHGRIGRLTWRDYQLLEPQSSWGWWEV